MGTVGVSVIVVGVKVVSTDDTFSFSVVTTTTFCD